MKPLVFVKISKNYLVNISKLELIVEPQNLVFVFQEKTLYPKHFKKLFR